jgi:hypothetical protein
MIPRKAVNFFQRKCCPPVKKNGDVMVREKNSCKNEIQYWGSYGHIPSSRLAQALPRQLSLYGTLKHKNILKNLNGLLVHTYICSYKLSTKFMEIFV